MEHVRRRIVKLKTVRQDVMFFLKVGGSISLSLGASIAISAIEVLIVSDIGTTELAGVSLAVAYFSIVFITCLGIIVAITPILSKLVSENKKYQVALYGQSGLIVTLLVSICGTVALICAHPILQLLELLPKETKFAMDYLFYATPALPTWLFYIAFRSILIAVGKVSLTTKAVVLSVPIHAILSYELVNGILIMPPLGVVGAGLAYTLGSLFMIVIVIISLSKNKCEYLKQIFRFPFSISITEIRHIFQLGFPMSLRILAREGILPATTLIVMPFGENSLAIHAVTIRIVSLASIPAFGISNALIQRISFLLGSGRNAEILKAFYIAISTALFCSVFAIITIAISSNLIISQALLSADPQNFDLMRHIILIACIFVLIDSLQGPANAALVAYQDVRMPLWIFIICTWGIGIPASYILSNYYFGNINGVWVGMCIGILLSSICLFYRFFGKVK